MRVGDRADGRAALVLLLQIARERLARRAGDPLEVAAFGIKVTMIEPGGFATDFATSSAYPAHRHEAYGPLYAAMAEMGAAGPMPGPEAVGGAILQIVDAEEPPLRVFFG
ncbi:hypothetical protein ACFVZG_49485, partial [Streptomyces sp. NPDC058296]